MITDPIALAEIKASWAAARAAQDLIQRNVLFAFAQGGWTSEPFRELCYSLAVVFAYSVLDDALEQLRDEGVFSCSKSNLGALMQNSQGILPWVDYALVDAGRQARNKTAHDRLSMPIPDAWKYVDAIEAELTAWGIL